MSAPEDNKRLLLLELVAPFCSFDDLCRVATAASSMGPDLDHAFFNRTVDDILPINETLYRKRLPEAQFKKALDRASETAGSKHKDKLKKALHLLLVDTEHNGPLEKLSQRLAGREPPQQVEIDWDTDVIGYHDRSDPDESEGESTMTNPEWEAWQGRAQSIKDTWSSAIRLALRLLAGRAPNPSKGNPKLARTIQLKQEAARLGIQVPEKSAVVQSFLYSGDPNLEETLDLLRERFFLGQSSNYTGWLGTLQGFYGSQLKNEYNDVPVKDKRMEDRRQAAIAAAVEAFQGPPNEIPPTLRHYSLRAVADELIEDFGLPDYNAVVEFYRKDEAEMEFGPELTSRDRWLIHQFAEDLGLGHRSTGKGVLRKLKVETKN